MKQMKSMLGILFMCTSIITHAQHGNSGGIKWATGLTWKQVLEKAKKENKYIFLDCFTTWCGPCKMMDKDVYTNDTVGQFFNDKFISVKVQMDRTSKDEEDVKTWYFYADFIGSKYFVFAYPTHLFLSPSGVAVHKETGFKSPIKFIDLATTALEPGRAYIDPAAELATMMETWEKEKDFSKLSKMVKTARIVGNVDAEMKLLKELSQYMAVLPEKERYTKERIEIWKNVILPSSSKVFAYFYNDAKRIDDVMTEKGFSNRIVDKTIFNEIGLPFLEEQNKNSNISMRGGYLGGKDLPIYSDEADWKQLEKIITEKFNRRVAKRNVLAAKVEWYSRHNNHYQKVKNALLQFNKYPPPPNERLAVNELAWTAFEHVNDRKLLNKVIKTAGEVASKDYPWYALMDTYANLLYKVGRTKEALVWEQKAADAANAKGIKSEAANYQSVIDLMKKGEPTYGVKPL